MSLGVTTLSSTRFDASGPRKHGFCAQRKNEEADELVGQAEKRPASHGQRQGAGQQPPEAESGGGAERHGTARPGVPRFEAGRVGRGGSTGGWGAPVPLREANYT